jgi:hypothetical protein
MCILSLVDDAGNKVEIRIHRDANLTEWLEAVRKILLFQQFCPANINAYFGE